MCFMRFAYCVGRSWPGTSLSRICVFTALTLLVGSKTTIRADHECRDMVKAELGRDKPDDAYRLGACPSIGHFLL